LKCDPVGVGHDKAEKMWCCAYHQGNDNFLPSPKMKLFLGLFFIPFAVALDNQIYEIQDQEYAEAPSHYYDEDYTYTEDYAIPTTEDYEQDEDYEEPEVEDYEDPAVEMSAQEFQSGKAEKLNQMSPSFRALIKNEDSADDTEVGDTAPVEGNDAARKYGIPANSPYTIVAGVLLICTGAFMLFFGQKAFKPILFISGAYVFGVFTYALLNYLRTHKLVTMERNVPLIYFASIAGGALLGGGFFLCLWKIAAYLFGAALGFVVSVFFLSLPFTVSFNQTVRIVILVVFVVLGIILGGFFEKPILIISTATLGSYWLFAGGDVFLKTGFGSLVRAMRDRQPIQMRVGTWLMLSGFVLMSIIGSVIQFRIARRATASYAPVSKV
jgi:hypothetical protein